MALLRFYMDQRQFTNATNATAGLSTLDSFNFAHGLPGTPHHVFIRYIASLNNGGATNTDWWGDIVAVGPANVTVSNPGTVQGPAMEVTSIFFHSIVE